MADVRSKGANFHGLLSAIERVHGEELRARVTAAVPGEAGDALRLGGVVTGGWYPIAWHDALLAATEGCLPGRRLAIRELTYAAVKHDFQTLFKVVSLVASPSFALTNSSKVMARYYEGGRVSVVESRDEYVHLRFDDYFGFTPRLWDDVHGGLEAIVDLMGVVRQPFEVRHAHGPRAEFVVRYKRA
ncbi:MAG: hypothetical protein OHK0013_02980 [Sandaracinaceae bacterium]